MDNKRDQKTLKPKITIAIPCHNNERTIWATLKSATSQEYPNKEILVIDDASTDRTVQLVRLFTGVRLIINDNNIGIGENLKKLMDEAQGKYIVYLCGDDVFTCPQVVGDIVAQFDKGDSDIGVIGRHYYYFRDGYEGAIGVCREPNILLQSCCPSGMAFRKMGIEATNRVFIEMPYIVKQYLSMWRWTMFTYDTVAARYHPGGNTGTKKEYYKQSPYENWVWLLGKEFKDYPSFIMLKNRAPKLLWKEIKMHVRDHKDCLTDVSFWFYALVACLVPGFLLRPLSNFYRHRIKRHQVKIIKRGE